MNLRCLLLFHRIEVYDNEKKVDSLNELEYINGEIWANIWMTDLIARIDPASGKVLAYINLKGILPDSDRESDTDVLNGIAYDKEGKGYLLQGKNGRNYLRSGLLNNSGSVNYINAAGIMLNSTGVCPSDSPSASA